MKKIIFLSLIFILTSCWLLKNNSQTSQNYDENIDISKIDEVKSFLQPKNNSSSWINKEKTQETQTNTGENIIDNKTTENIKPVEIKKTPINSDTKNLENQETNIQNSQELFTKEELEIIENSTWAEIDELINILFKDLE